MMTYRVLGAFMTFFVRLSLQSVVVVAPYEISAGDPPLKLLAIAGCAVRFHEMGMNNHPNEIRFQVNFLYSS